MCWFMNLLTYASKEKDFFSDNEVSFRAKTIEECSCKSSQMCLSRGTLIEDRLQPLDKIGRLD